MTVRTTILSATADLLAESPTGEISTRAICERAGVQQPTIYRLFGDKSGLLVATVDHAFSAYLDEKRRSAPAADPVAGIRDGWDAHTQYALANPTLYRLLFGTGLDRRPEGVAEAHALLRGLVDRAGSVGRLRTGPAEATSIIMAANTGIALALITRPEQTPDPSLSERVRDITLSGLFWDSHDLSDPADASAPLVDPAAAARTAAATARVAFAASPTTQLSPAEHTLLLEWLERAATTRD